MVDVLVFIVCAAIILGGAAGVILNSHPVRAALSLVASFFGVAVLFIQQAAHFLSLVQVVVYAGAIVVLFLFVIMLLGVDSAEDLSVEPLAGQRGAAALLSALVFALLLGGFFVSGPGGDQGAVAITGQESFTAPLPADESASDVNELAVDLFGRNAMALQATAFLLTIATIGAVVMVRNDGASDVVVDEPGTAEY